MDVSSIVEDVPIGVVARFLAQVAPADSAGCRRWLSYISPTGYGRFKLNGRTVSAYRVSYSWWVGPIPDDLQIDHLCRVRDCVNPGHLEAVTQAENRRRGSIPNRTHCVNDHPFDDANTYYRNGTRHCRACNAAAVRRYRTRTKEMSR